MSGEYHNYAEQMREKLNTISPTLCLAKWQQVSLHLPNGMTQSCYHPSPHKVPVELLADNPGALHNTPEKKSERKQMLEGKRPPGCSYCWKIEDAASTNGTGHLSDRHYRSSEWWCAPTFDEVTTNAFDYDVIPRNVEVNFNQACNFKCMYCSPHLSTEWEKEIRKNGGYVLTDMIHNDIKSLEQRGLMPLTCSNEDNPYVQAFWKWWPDIYRKLRVFRMTGGEPLMDANTFKVLDYVNNNPHGQLELSITSNLCPPDQKLFDKFVQQVKAIEEYRTYEDTENFNKYSGNHWYVDKGFKDFWLYVSVDSFGQQAEYIRDGLDFDRMLENVRTFLRETTFSHVSFINTFNILSIPNFKKFLNMILELRREFGGHSQDEFNITPTSTHGIDHKVYKQQKFQRIFFDIPILQYPPWFSIQLADDYCVNEMLDCLQFIEDNVQDENYGKTFEGFKPYEILKAKRDLAVMQDPLPENELDKHKANFYRFITEYDARRNKSFLLDFPELHDFWNDCYIAHKQ